MCIRERLKYVFEQDGGLTANTPYEPKPLKENYAKRTMSTFRHSHDTLSVGWCVVSLCTEVLPKPGVQQCSLVSGAISGRDAEYVQLRIGPKSDGLHLMAHFLFLNLPFSLTEKINGSWPSRKIASFFSGPLRHRWCDHEKGTLATTAFGSLAGNATARCLLLQGCCKVGKTRKLYVGTAHRV